MAQATLEFSSSDALRAAVAGGATITEITRSSTGWLDMVVSGYGLVALRGYAADERALMEYSDGSSLYGSALERAIQHIDWVHGQLTVRL